MNSAIITLLIGIGIVGLLVFFRMDENQAMQPNPVSTQQDTPVETKNTISEESFPFELNYKAPELKGLENWLNSQPVSSLDELKGKVVLVDFWTYSCVNCIRTLPYLNDWHAKYADDGLVILGIHAPEFAFEQILANVQKAVDKYDIEYPVVQDNNFSTWRSYKNRFWPAKYLIDKDGFVRYEHFGEGKYDETERAIVELLGSQEESSDVNAVSVDFSQIQTRETYLGSKRRANFSKDFNSLQSNQWGLSGQWKTTEENIETLSAGSSLKIIFTAAKANLVIEGTGTVEVLIDGKTPEANAGKDVKDGVIQLNGAQLYEIANFGDKYQTHTLELIFQDAGTKAFAFTFG
jgi:thiol-disulfide isomerase/thioredoxin